MKIIAVKQISDAVRQMAMDASYHLESDILEALLRARDEERAGLAKNVLDVLLVNADIASRESMPVCQDTGVAVLFAFVGQEVQIEGELENAIQEGIRLGYSEGYLRNSVCDPLTRKNTGTNTPAVVHYEIVPGDELTLHLLPKGCGSENMSGLRMLPPSAGSDGIVRFVVDLVLAAGSNPCPPGIVGVGVGGTFERAAYLAKKSLLRPVGEPHARSDVAALESRILKEINAKGQGVHGFGGSASMLAVHMELYPTHIASLPVAVNVQCHAHRHKRVTL